MFVGASAESVTFTAGERAPFVSSPGVRRGFCARCGTPLTCEGDRFPGETHFQVSTFDDPRAFRPTFHVYYEDRLERLEIADSLSRHATASGRTDEG